MGDSVTLLTLHQQLMNIKGLTAIMIMGLDCSFLIARIVYYSSAHYKTSLLVQFTRRHHFMIVWDIVVSAESTIRMVACRRLI